jgi:hypothetical protein
MNIATIQKRKFLNNIYKLLYSSGKTPTEQEVRRIFSAYFSVNEFGLPANVNYSLLQNVNVTDVDIINDAMATTLLNMEVLNDCILENNEELFSVINVLNSKLDGLRAKRRVLEAKVDELIFINNNSDGYYYSFLDDYFNTDNIDLALTNAFIDIEKGQVKIPKITSNLSNALTVDNIQTLNVTYSIIVNGNTVSSSQRAVNFDNVFDGLNDTYWSIGHLTQTPSIVSLQVDIPIPNTFSISRVAGKLLTITPTTTHITCTPANIQIPEHMDTQEPNAEYNQFSFAIPTGAYNKISLTFVKVEHDTVVAGSQSPYAYSFGIREMSIGAEYHETNATIVSNPISIPTSDNSNLFVAAVALESKAQLPPGTEAKYYVCQHTVDYGNITDYNWIQIEPTALNSRGKDIPVNFLSSNFYKKYISNFIIDDFQLIPKNTTSPNINEKNPSILPNSNKTVYRVCALKSDEKLINPYILSDVNNMRHWYTLPIADTRNGSQTSYYKSLDTWNNKIKINTPGDVYNATLLNQSSQISINNSGVINGIIKFNLYCDESIKVNHNVVKSSDGFNLGIYLNGILIADLPAGTASTFAEWDLLTGDNNVIITYDKSITGPINFNITAGASLNDYGTIYLDYYRYLDPIDFRNKITENDNVFTIDNFYTRREIISSKEISNRSLIRYYSNNNQLYNSIRYRIDLRRYNNPLQTPVIDSVRIKFKHIDN